MRCCSGDCRRRWTGSLHCRGRRWRESRGRNRWGRGGGGALQRQAVESRTAEAETGGGEPGRGECEYRLRKVGLTCQLPILSCDTDRQDTDRLRPLFAMLQASFWPRFLLFIPIFPDPWLQQQRYVAKLESVLLNRRSAISRVGQQQNGPAGTTDLDLDTLDLDLPRGALAWQPQAPASATPGGEHAAMPVHQQLDLDAEVSPFCCWEDQQGGQKRLAAPDEGITSAGQAVPDQGVKAASSAAGAAAPLVLAATPKGSAWGPRRLATAHTAPARGRQASLALLKQQREQRRRCSAAQSNGYDKPEAPAAPAAKGALAAMTAAAPLTRAAQRSVTSATDATQPTALFQGFTPGEAPLQVVKGLLQVPCQGGGFPLPEGTEDLEADITSMQRGLEVRAVSAQLSLVKGSGASTETGSQDVPLECPLRV